MCPSPLTHKLTHIHVVLPPPTSSSSSSPNTACRHTLEKTVKTSARRYAPQFISEQAARPPPGGGRHTGTPEEVGPGTYTVHDDVQCGGIKVFREQWRPSSMFAGRVGGKFANVGDDF